MREHGGYVNYPMWCALNQLVLDDVAGRGQVSRVVEQIEQERAILDAEAAEAAEKMRLRQEAGQ